MSSFTSKCGDPRCIVCRNLPSVFPAQAREEAREAWARVRSELADPHSDLNRRDEERQG